MTDSAADVRKKLLAPGKALGEAGDDAKKAAAITSYSESVAGAITDGDGALANRIEQLAEESALLWWVLAEYSDALQRPISELSPETYALAAAVEAAQRTIQLPPLPSIGSLLARALRLYKATNKKLVLADYVKATDPIWRADHVKSVIVADCRDLSPLCAAIEKTEELGSAATAITALPKFSPGVNGKLPLTPAEAAQQFYNEIVFLRALDAVANK